MKNFLSSLTALILSISVSAEIPEGAIPFILDSHVYIQATLCDTVPVSIIYDSGADRLYLDKDYMALSDFGKQPFRKGKARMGGAGNDGAQTIPIIIDEIPMTMGKVVHKEKITPIINHPFGIIKSGSPTITAQLFFICMGLNIPIFQSFLLQIGNPVVI